MRKISIVLAVMMLAGVAYAGPIYDMEVDRAGRVWATTGGTALMPEAPLSDWMLGGHMNTDESSLRAAYLCGVRWDRCHDSSRESMSGRPV